MKITYNWLKDFVDISLKPQTLAERLTMSGLEVTSQEKLEDDYVFEIEVTSNRPDWLSVIGIAREVAAITGKKLKLSKATSLRSQVTSYNLRPATCDLRLFDIEIKDKEACPFYSARIIRNLKVKPSPPWLAKRLLAIGLRPINNIVDITNYVLFTTGQPLHAFDLDKIVRRLTGEPASRLEISVRKAQEGEEIITIDGEKRILNKEIIVIASLLNGQNDKPIAIAGIMGGKESEVNAATRNILLESAYFSPIVTRRASRLLGLSSDSSYRFERSVDKGGIMNASNFASSLILENTGGGSARPYQAGSPKVSKKIIILDVDKTNKLIGKDLTIAKIKSILRALEFKIGRQKKNILSIEVPCPRQDIKSEADLIEELCRISGYENVPLTLPAISPPRMREDEILAVQQKIRELLSAWGFNEIITYSLLSMNALRKARQEAQDLLRLENPSSAEQEILRPNLLTGLLTALSRNLELRNRPCAFFEIGDVFNRNNEFKALGLIKESGGLLELKGKLEFLLQGLGINNYSFLEAVNPAFAKGQCASILIKGESLGLLGKLNQEVLADFKIDNPEVVVLELSLDRLKQAVNLSKTYRPIPKYPSVARDLSLIIDEAVSYQKIVESINSCGLKNLEAIRFKDIYRSQAMGKEKKSLSLSLEFRLTYATLTDTEVNSSLQSLIQFLSQELGASIK